MFSRSRQLLVFVLLTLSLNQAWGQLSGSYYQAQFEPVTLYFQQQDSGFAQTAAKTIRANWSGIAELIGLSGQPDIYVLIAESEETFDRMTQGRIPDWGAGAADPGSGFIFLKSPRITPSGKSQHEIVIHELSHVLLGKATEGFIAPRWFDEGLAQVVSGERQYRASLRLARSFLTGQVLWLDQIHNVLVFRKDEAGLAYETAHSAVVFLMTEYGDEVIAQIVGELATDHSMDEALQNTIHLSLGEFESDWYEAMRHRNRWAMLLEFPVVLSTSLVVLLIAAFVSTRQRAKKRRQQWEIESENEIQVDQDYTTSD